MKTPIALVSFSRCSSEPKSRVCAIVDPGTVGLGAGSPAAGVGFGAAVAAVSLGFETARPEGAAGEALIAEGVAGVGVATAAGTAAGTGAGTGAGAVAGGGTGGAGVGTTD